MKHEHIATESERTGLPHPTPVAIRLAIMAEVERHNAEAARRGLLPIPAIITRVLRDGMRRANEQHHGRVG